MGGRPGSRRSDRLPVGLTRRGLLAGGGRAALAGVLGPALVARAAEPPTLRIAQWAHFVPAFDQWFDQTFARQWGERHGVRVEVDHFSVGELRARAAAEVAAGRGHDLFGFIDPPPGYEGYVAPMTDVVQECERRVGRLAGLARRGTFNPASQQYFALSDMWAPAPLHYRADWWGEVGVTPDAWDRVRDGARRIRARRGATAGFGLAPEPDSNMTLRSLLWAFGAAEQDEAGRVAINSRATVEAVKLMAALYRESMTSDVLVWDPSSNNRVFVWGRASIIENAISAMRTMESHNPELAARAALAPPPAGPGARLGAAHVLHCYVAWKSSPRVELAKRFLVDLVQASEAAFAASAFYNLPSFPGAVPDLARKLGPAGDPRTRGRYALLAEAERWSAWAGHPGSATAAIEETVHRSVIPVMFARAARGELGPEEAVRQAEVEMRRIFARWSR